MFRTAFKEAIGKYLVTAFPSEANRAKDEIIKIVATTKDPNAREQIKEVLAEVEIVTQWMESHFSPGSLYVDRGLVFGWWHKDQLQAESLPVALSQNYFKGFPRKMEVFANRNGFSRPVPLPLVNGAEIGQPGCSIVLLPESKTEEYARYGWANALPLQWCRSWSSRAIVVTHSVAACGFWAAWKWWPGARNFYAKNPPYPLAEAFQYCEQRDCES
jgi:hypothetical protein